MHYKHVQMELEKHYSLLIKIILNGLIDLGQLGNLE
jgi:hypothetical protein